MAALTATAWTETVEERFIEGKHKRNRVKLELSATQGLVYPSSGGIPLPTTMGMVRNIDYVNVIQELRVSGATGLGNNFIQQYDKENHSIHIFQGAASDAAKTTGFVEVPTTFAPSLGYGTNPIMYVEAVGW